MAAKCNIASLAIKKLNKLHWGINISDVEDAILENYIEQLDCKDTDLIVCYEEPCVNNPVIVNCNLAISLIQSSIFENTVTFSIPTGGITNGIAPYSYKWTYEVDDFTQSGPININTSTLTVKPSKDINFIISNISVEITDANGCKATKSCWITPSGMQCAENYAPCLPNSLLTVTNKTIVCSPLSSLVVTKKL